MIKYGTQKMLAKLGYTFPGDSLCPEEVEAFSIIASEISKIEKKRK